MYRLLRSRLSGCSFFFSFFFLIELSHSRNSSDDIAYCGQELRRCGVKPRFIEAYILANEVINVILAMTSFREKYARRTRDCPVEAAARERSGSGGRDSRGLTRRLG